MSQPVPYGRAPEVQSASPQRAVMIVAVLGLCASFGSLLSFMPALKTQIGVNPYYYIGIVKHPIYYVLHATEILLMVAAGLLALCSTNSREITRGFLWRFALFLAAGALMAARGYTLMDLLSTKLADATGPLACLISVVIFVGMRRSHWAAIDTTVLVTAFALSAVSLYEIAGLRTAAREEAVRSMLPVVNALFFPAAWTALRPCPQSSAGRWMRLAPAAVYALGSLFTEMRLNFVMLFALLGICVYVDRRRGVRKTRRWVAALGISTCLLLSIPFLRGAPVFKKVEAAAEGLYSRLGQDSRSGQLREFFRSVPSRELLLGRGSFATWLWNGWEWNGGTDVGYLNLLFFGGVPLLVTYFAVHVAPPLEVLRRRPEGLQLTAAAISLLWAIRMFSSAAPSLTLDYYLVLMCVGACISRELQDKSSDIPVLDKSHRRLPKLSS